MGHDVESLVRGRADRVAPGTCSPDPYPVSRRYPHQSFWTKDGLLFAARVRRCRNSSDLQTSSEVPPNPFVSALQGCPATSTRLLITADTAFRRRQGENTYSFDFHHHFISFARIFSTVRMS